MDTTQEAFPESVDYVACGWAEALVCPLCRKEAENGKRLAAKCFAVEYIDRSRSPGSRVSQLSEIRVHQMQEDTTLAARS
jgi:hypothetical protein